MSQKKAARHKHTVYCPINKCKYTSRQWIIDVRHHKDWGKDQRESVFSTKCPFHQTTLVTIDKLKSDN